MNDLIRRKDVEQMLTALGGCDASDKEAAGWDKAIDAAMEGLRKVESADKWILCSERLPDEGKEVLISYDYDSFDIEMTPKRYLGVMIGYYEDSEWWSSDEWTDGVTAWYPLPEPWEGEYK